MLIDHIVMDLMDAAAIENGRLSLSREPVSLSDLIESTCDAQFALPDVNANTLIYDLEPDLPLIWADPVRIEQVVTNLITNAVRHTKNGEISVKLCRKQNLQVVGVRDSGEGMEPELADIVFRQYSSTSRDHWRHGIGLYLCRQIILAHGGDIWIASKKNEGTTATFTLPEDKRDE